MQGLGLTMMTPVQQRWKLMTWAASLVPRNNRSAPRYCRTIGTMVRPKPHLSSVGIERDSCRHSNQARIADVGFL